MKFNSEKYSIQEIQKFIIY